MMRPRNSGDCWGSIEEALSSEKLKGFLIRLRRGRIRIRDFDAVLVTQTLEAALGRADLSARQLYGSVTLSDQAQMREFYLSKIEEVEPALRARFKKHYQYC